MVTKIYLIRHCQSMGNVQHRFQGRFDAEVSPDGAKQLELLGLRFRNQPIDAIYTSPLQRARATAERWGLTERMDLRLGSGLDVLAPGEADTVVIAGMGGDTLVDILAAAPWCRETALLLQPMSRAEVLRPWLAANGFAIRRERLVQDRGVLYPILDVSGGEMALSESEAWGGVLLGDDPLWGRFLEEQILRKAEKSYRKPNRLD